MSGTRDLNVLIVGRAVGLLSDASKERVRIQQYASRLGSCHVLVCSREVAQSKNIIDGNLFIYAVYAKTGVGIFIKAFFTGVHILWRRRTMQWIITSQDPFEMSVIGRLLSLIFRTSHQVQIHGDFFGSTYWVNERWSNHFWRQLGLFIIRHSACVRAVSKRIKNSLIQQNVMGDHIIVLPIRSQLETFVNVARENGEDVIRVVSICRLAREKNLLSLIDAYALAYMQCPQLTLEIVGSGPEEAAIREHIRVRMLEQKIVMTPWTEDIPAVLARADIFALASTHEGYALVLIEALAAGVPVVTTDVGCAGELVKDGVHGKIVSVGDVGAFAGALAALAKNNEMRGRYSNNGRLLGKELASFSETAYTDAWISALVQCATKC